MTDQQAIREYIVRTVSLWINSDEGTLKTVEQMVSEYIEEDAANGNGCRDEYEIMLRNGTMRDEYAMCAGMAVTDWLQNMINDEGDTLAARMLSDLLDLGDRDQMRMLGDKFLPGVDNINWPDEDEEDSDDDECQGHESLDGAHMGKTVYCDGTCIG